MYEHIYAYDSDRGNNVVNGKKSGPSTVVSSLLCTLSAVQCLEK